MAWFSSRKSNRYEEEALLLQKVADGNAAACRLLSQRHLGRIVTFAHGMLNDPVEAEDVAQEVFLKLWQMASRWRPEARVDTWLYTVARNLCQDRLRKKRPQLPGELPEMWDESPTPLEKHHQKQVSQVVETALGKLPERQRAAILMVHYQEMKGEEAATILDISIEALESLLARGRSNLRQQLTGRRVELLGGEE